MYKIEIDYSTGNTFGSSEETRIIDDVVFSDIESAKQALKIIAKHKEMCEAASRTWGMTDAERKQHRETLSQQPWAVKSEYGNDYEYRLKVPTYENCQEWSVIYCFWMGYFETLHEARIVDVGNDELSISFR